MAAADAARLLQVWVVLVVCCRRAIFLDQCNREVCVIGSVLVKEGSPQLGAPLIVDTSPFYIPQVNAPIQWARGSSGLKPSAAARPHPIS